MKSAYYFLVILVLSCSPYKKVVLTMSDQMTQRWTGAPLTDVQKHMGEYQSKTVLADGYVLRYDYSYNITGKLQDKNVTAGNGMQVGARVGNNNSLLVPKDPTLSNPDPRSKRYDDSRVIKFVDFYFDNTQRVRNVHAEGYPDSIYYVSRK